MKAIICILIIGLSSCSFIDDPQYSVDPVLRQYVDNFFVLADKYGKSIPKPNSLSIGLVKGLEDKENAWGQAERGTTDIHRIWFDYDVVMGWVSRGDSLSIERLVLHEMGHSILRRGHTKKYSIMNDVDFFDDYIRFEDRREKLRFELFNGYLP